MVNVYIKFSNVKCFEIFIQLEFFVHVLQGFSNSYIIIKANNILQITCTYRPKEKKNYVYI